MLIKNDKTTAFKSWRLDPFEELQRVWGAITGDTSLGIPHIVGRASFVGGNVSGLEIKVVLHTEEGELVFKDGNDVYFIIPANPQDGLEGIYMKLNNALRNAR